MEIKRMSGNKEITTLDTTIMDTYERLSKEIMDAYKRGNIKRSDELLEELLDYMKSVGDVR